jgi:hypothetical protein
MQVVEKPRLDHNDSRDFDAICASLSLMIEKGAAGKQQTCCTKLINPGGQFIIRLTNGGNFSLSLIDTGATLSLTFCARLLC